MDVERDGVSREELHYGDMVYGKPISNWEFRVGFYEILYDGIAKSVGPSIILTTLVSTNED
jgi:hypothetical protein